MTTYTRPTLTDLGQVEDLTQVTLSIKLSVPGYDIHVSKSGTQTVNPSASSTGISVSL